MSNTPAPEPLYDAIGRVTAEGVLLEHSLRGLLAILDFSLTLSSYANAASLKQLIDFCELANKVKLTAEPYASEVTQVLERADALRLRRNDIVHSLWSRQSGEVQDSQPPTFVGSRPTRRQIGMRALPAATLDDMRQIAAEIFLLRDDMFVLTYNMGMSIANPAGDLIARSGPLVNPHGPTPDGRSIPPDAAEDTD